MMRLIDADKLIETRFPFVLREDYDGEALVPVRDVLKAIRLAPTADAVEVRHAYWRQNPYCKRIYFCSECGRHIEDGSNNPLEFFPYCHCGAKMDGGKE